MGYFEENAQYGQAVGYRTVSQVSVEERTAFYQKVYSLFFLGFAVLSAFAVLGVELVKQGILTMNMVFGLILVETAIVWFGMGQAKSKKAGMSLMFLYAAITGLTFGPLLTIAMIVGIKTGAGSYSIIIQGFGLTTLAFGGLTAYVFTTKQDFTYMGGFLSMMFMGVLGFVFFVWMGFIQMTSGMSLVFCGLMVLLLSLDVLYTTSKIQRMYSTEHTVLAAFELLIGFALMLWYIIRLLIILNSRE